MNFVAAATDPQQKLIFQALLIFWVVFMLKNIYHYAWVQNGRTSEAPQVAEAPRTRSATRASAEGATRRRRAQRA
jgi:hypothetical protein